MLSQTGNMTAERLKTLLEDLTLLENVPLQELKELQLTYPYSQNIQFLVLKKMESAGLLEQSIAENIVYFPDKKQLHDQLIVSPVDKQLAQIEIEKIDADMAEIFDEIEYNKDAIEEEQIDISSKIKPEVQEEIEQDELEYIEIPTPEPTEEIPKKKIPTLKSNKQKKNQIQKIKKENKKVSKKLNVPKEETTKTKKKPIKKKAKLPKLSKSKITKKDKKQATNKKPSSAIKTKTAEKPTKEQSFLDWLDSLETVNEIITTKRDKKASKKKAKQKKDKKPKVKGAKIKKQKGKKKSKKNKKKLSLQDKIDASVSRKDVVVSPTLAKLMEKQGHNKEAIKIYKQLMLNIPEKSSYFAAQIKKLK